MLHHIEKCLDIYFSCIPRRLPRQEDVANVALIAHRGAHSPLIQENTHAAFEHAIALGCAGVELDVQITADQVLVVNHDPTLKRLWGHEVAINSLTFSELQKLVPDLPSLEEVVTRYGKQMRLFIEIKPLLKNTEVLAETLKSLIPGKDYYLLSLHAEAFQYYTSFPKEALLLVPLHNNVSSFCRLSLEQPYGGILGHYLLLNNYKVQELRTANQLVGVGFIDSKRSLYREINRGIELLFTNNAAAIAKYLRELQS